MEDNKHYLLKFTNYQNLDLISEEIDTSLSQISVLKGINVIIPLNTLVDINEEINKLNQEKAKMIGEIKRCEGMLSNPNFTAKAPKEKVDSEKAKLEDYKNRLDNINALLSRLSK